MGRGFLRFLRVVFWAIGCKRCEPGASNRGPGFDRAPRRRTLTRRRARRDRLHTLHPTARRRRDGGAPPPLPGDDVRKNRGIGIEYESAGGLYALSQWPSHGVSPEGATPVGTEAGCPISMFRRAGFLWQSATRISTLQPDGDAAPSSVLHEARRIIREGACRDRR